MKTLLISALFVVSSVGADTIPSSATAKSDPMEAGNYSVSERGANHRVWQKATWETNKLGEIKGMTNSYTELGTGLHFLKDGQWQESEAKIEITPDGASANKGGHKVNFAPNINTVGAIDLTTSDGKAMRSHVIGLSYFDVATGKSALIAEIKDSIGVLHAPNQIIYEDAFTDFKADLRYTYTLAGFEQDLILKEQPISPEKYGLDSKTTRLQLLTEFIDPPVPVKEQVNQEGLQVDKTLDFGEMQIGTGKAFGTGDGNQIQNEINVDKTWTKLDDRNFLIEDLKYGSIEEQLQTLPASPQAALKPQKDGVRHVVSNKRLLPQRREARAEVKKTIKVASVVSNQKGFVIDYSIVVNQTNFTFKGDTTYYVSAAVNLSSTTTIEEGTVIKYTNSSSAKITMSVPRHL